MANLGVPLPALFLPCTGQPAIPFEMWIKMFENYLLAIHAEGDDWPDTRKRAILLHCLGTEGQRVFYTLPDAGTTYKSAMDALRVHFIPAINVVVERHKFRQRVQRPHETVTDYIAALRELATTCGFDGHTDEMIRDQLIEHASCSKVRERLIMQTDATLTLDKAARLACQVEAAIGYSKSLTSEPQAPVHVVTTKSKRSFKTRARSNSSAQPTAAHGSAESAAAPKQEKCCFRCGSSAHLANAQDCPAREVTCRTCNKKGHFARVCRSKEKIAKVREVIVLEMNTVHMLQDDQPAKKIVCTVTINAQSTSSPVELVVDTGAAVSIIPEPLYRQHFSDVPLAEPLSRLVSYTKTDVPVLGCLSATVQHADTTVPATLYVVKNTGTALLGMDLFRALGLSIINNSVLPSAAPVAEVNAGPATGEKLGLAKGFVHRIKVREDVQPVQQKLRRLPLSVKQAVSVELERLLEMDVIERIDASPWVSPIVVTRRKNGAVRMCVDLREPNKAVVMDSHPLPHMDDLFSEMRGATVFSTIDLANAYHQVLLAEESRDMTAFITHEGLFRFRRVPYGLCSAPSAFSKMMSLVLKDLKGVQNYLDDVIVYGTDKEDHDRNLQAVLTALKEAGLQLNKEKCHFNQTSLRFLGHTISAQGLLPVKDHLKAITEAPAPTDDTTLRSFLGLTGWYAKYVENYASLVEPMRECLRGDTFQWTAAAQSSYDAVKAHIVNSPALSVFDPSLPTIVSTDASDYGLGAILTQMHPDGTERTVACASRSLNSAERKYSIVEKEALACVWAAERWRTFLWGTKFTLRTDHQALTTLLTTKGLGRAGMRIARWSARLLCFTYDVVYRPGAQNHAADCLSRLPLPSEENAEAVTEPELVALLDTELKALSVTDFTGACEACPELTALRMQMERGWPKTAKSLPAILKPYFATRDELSVQDMTIYRGPYRRLVPVALRKQLVDLAHETHQGIVRTKQRLRDLYWWPGMDTSVQESIRACVTCQMNDKSTKTHPAPLQPVPLPDGPWRKVGIDIVGPFESANWDCRYAVTLVDYYTKWPEIAFTPSITTTAVTTFLSTVFARFGNPTELVSDNGPQFTSSEFADFLAVRDITHRKVSLYYPQANGAIERWNRVLKETILSAEQERKPWKPFVQEYLLTYRSTPHSTTGVSPHELMFNRKMRTKVDIGPAVKYTPLPEKQLRNRVISKQNTSKAYTDGKRGARVPRIKEGSLVRVRKPFHVKKGLSKFYGPARVIQKAGSSAYVLEDGRTWNATHLSLVPESATDVSEEPECPTLATGPAPAPEPGPAQPLEDSIDRPARVRKKPAWLNDYEH